MAKVKTYYITMLQNWQWGFARKFTEVNGLKPVPVGYTDSSSTTYTWRLRTGKTIDQVQDMVWAMNGGGWACVQDADPRAVGLP